MVAFAPVPKGQWRAWHWGHNSRSFEIGTRTLQSKTGFNPRAVRRLSELAELDFACRLGGKLGRSTLLNSAPVRLRCDCFSLWGLMFDPATTALLRAVLDEVCEDVSRYETGARTHVTSRILEAEGQHFARQAEAGRPRGSPRCANDVAIGGGERGVNFQVTVLKILVSYPDGFALIADLKRDMAILATSGPDWGERIKRLGALVPDLDIFSQGLVERMNGGGASPRRAADCWRSWKPGLASRIRQATTRS